MVYEIRSKEEFVRAVKGNDVVLIELYDPDNDECVIMYESMKEFSKYADRNVLFCRLNVKEHPDVIKAPSTPMLQVYYKGELVFEQIGVLSTVELNMKVVRRSIREIFKSRNINVRI